MDYPVFPDSANGAAIRRLVFLDTGAGAGIEIIELDIFGLSQEIAAAPAAFGFTNANDPARFIVDGDGQLVDVTAVEVGTVINPDDHVYYDDVYPTRNWHELVAARALEKLLADSP